MSSSLVDNDTSPSSTSATSTTKALLIDVRSPEEYATGYLSAPFDSLVPYQDVGATRSTDVAKNNSNSYYSPTLNIPYTEMASLPQILDAQSTRSEDMGGGARVYAHARSQNEHGYIEAAGESRRVKVDLYCRSGRRSHIAKLALEEMGFHGDDVRDLGGLEEASGKLRREFEIREREKERRRPDGGDLGLSRQVKAGEGGKETRREGRLRSFGALKAGLMHAADGVDRDGG